MLFTFLIPGIQVAAQNISASQADSIKQITGQSVSDSARIFNLLKVAQYHIFKPHEYGPDLDTASLYLNRAIRLASKSPISAAAGFTHIVESYWYWEAGNRQKGKQKVSLAITILGKIRSNALLGDAYSDLAKYYGLADDEIGRKLFYNEKALTAYQSAGNIRQQAAILQMIADIQSYQNDFTRSSANLDKALILYRSINHRQLHGIYILLSANSFEANNYKEALRYGFLALNTAEQVGDTSIQLATIQNKLGLIFFRMTEYTKASEFFDNALQVAKRNHDVNAIYLIVGNYCNALNRMNEPDKSITLLKNTLKFYPLPDEYMAKFTVPETFLETYTKLKDYQKGLPFCLQLQKFLNTGDIAFKRRAFPAILHFYIMGNNYAEANKHFNMFNAFATRHTTTNVRKGVEQFAYKLDSMSGNFTAAFVHLQALNQIQDSIAKANKTRELKSIEVFYETKKKETEIKLKDKNIQLLVQEARGQEARLRFVRNSAFAGIVLIAVIGFLVYRQYNQKQKATALITEKHRLLEEVLKEKEWLLKEVHHRVKNNLHTVISLLESQAAFLENDALKAIEVSQHRIYAMSLIHQKLYQSEDIKTVDMSNYIPEFVSYLAESFENPANIKFNLRVEPIEVGVNQAVPMALILNEAITNAIKYAFPGFRKGTIDIAFFKEGERLKLKIADDGVGLSESLLANPRRDSLGLKLIRGLARELHADVDIHNFNGLKIVLTMAEFKVSRL